MVTAGGTEARRGNLEVQMQFASDNWSGATDAVMAALMRHGTGFMPAYGGDPVSTAVTRRLRAVFETELEVWFVGSGTAANALSIAAAARPGGLVFCSENAHLYHDEMGAAEFFSGGMKLVPLPARNGLITPEALTAGVARFPAGNRTGHPAILSLTQASELGTVYPAAAIAELAAIAHAHGMAVHMDGARFANAMAGSGETPAVLTWRSGIDIMSFCGTKNGCWAADAILVFAPERFADLGVLRQRSGHGVSKARFIAAQFEGYLENDNWLETARHANAMAARLAAGLAASTTARLGWETAANEVFAVLPNDSIARLRAAGAAFHEWPEETPASDGTLVRLVTSWATSTTEVDRFLELV